MIFSIVRHRSNSNAYTRIIEKLKFLSEQPDCITEVRVKVPVGRYFTQDQVARIEEEFLPLVQGQECLQFGELTKLSSFWQKDGYLSGLGAIHLFAHLLLGQVGRSHTVQSRSNSVIKERIYRPNPAYPLSVSIVFTGELKLQPMRHLTKRSWKSFEKLLELGTLEQPAADSEDDKRVLVAAS